MVWNSGVSSYVDVDYGVRQGSILGPVLFLLHVADISDYLGETAKNNSVNSGDTKKKTAKNLDPGDIEP
jgi:hypothetical protein